jgi:phytoene dehydrogenase-like protein
MTRRATVTFDDETYERLARRARRHGRSVNREIREAVERVLAEESPNAGPLRLAGILKSASQSARSMHEDQFASEVVNQVWLDLAASFAEVDFGPHPPSDSAEFKPWLRDIVTGGEPADSAREPRAS